MTLQASFLKKQKTTLLQEKTKIEERITKLKKFPNYGTDEEDNIQELEDYENNLSIEEQLEFLLKKIDKALLAIEKGTYGICSICKDNIEQGRLEVMPYAEICVSCKSNKKG